VNHPSPEQELGRRPEERGANPGAESARLISETETSYKRRREK
jgi:hypothetical protein